MISAQLKEITNEFTAIQKQNSLRNQRNEYRNKQKHIALWVSSAIKKVSAQKKKRN